MLRPQSVGARDSRGEQLAHIAAHSKHIAATFTLCNVRPDFFLVLVTLAGHAAEDWMTLLGAQSVTACHGSLVEIATASRKCTAWLSLSRLT